MKLLSHCLSLITIVTLSRSLEATTCVQFPSSIYDDARTYFKDAQPSLRLPSDDTYALNFQTLIRLGFNADSAAATCMHPECNTKALVNRHVGRMKLTAAHFAAMFGDVRSLEWLEKHDANFNEQDAAGFTPAHFAALQRTRDNLDFLIAAKVDMRIQNKWGATPEQLWRLTHLIAPKDQRILYHDWMTSRLTFLDGDSICILTGKTFVEWIKQGPKAVLETWYENNIVQEDPFAQTPLKELSSFRTMPGTLYLNATRSLRFLDPLTANDHVAFAAKRFEYGDIVDVYAGEWSPEHKDLKTQVDGVDVSTYRGFLSYTANGFPNIAIVPFKNRLGLKSGHAAVAIRSILPCEALTLDYADVEARFEIPVEKNPDALDAFLEQHKLDFLLNNFCGFESKELRNLRSLGVIHYIARYAPVFIRLIAEQKMTVAQMRRIAKYTFLRINSTDCPDGPIVNILDIVLNVMQEKFLNPVVRDFFSKKAREGNVQILLLALQNLQTRKCEVTSELESLWRDTLSAFCRFDGNAKKPACLQTFSRTE